MHWIFEYFIFPGFLFAASVGLMTGWFDRKVTARLQWRVGPPWHQNFTDLIKLCGKEIITPEGTRGLFLGAPCMALIGSSLVAAMVGMALVSSKQGFVGDLIVAMYLLTLPPIALILGASASRNPLASVGASREIKLLISYELPFVLALVAVIIRSQGVVRLNGLVAWQAQVGSYACSWSGGIAFVVAIFSCMAKLGMGLFDVAEAEQEIMAGTLIEYSGFALALYKVSKAILLYTLPIFLIVLFWGKDTSLVFVALKYTAIILVFILIKNTNPRLRIDQITRFFWGPVTIAALIAVGLAFWGF